MERLYIKGCVRPAVRWFVAPLVCRVIARCVLAGRYRAQGWVVLYLLLSRVPNTHTGSRSRGGYPLGAGGREEGKKGGTEGKLGVREVWAEGKGGEKN